MKILFILLGFIIGRAKKTTLKREGKPYLVRITLFSCPWFSIKLHKALMSDPAIPHDHPWNYMSIILWGGYWEETLQQGIAAAETSYIIKKWYGPGSILFRKGDKFHKLIIPEGKFSLSLIFTGRKWREWGFYDFYKGWRSHKEIKY